MANLTASDPWGHNGPPPLGGDYDKGPRITSIAWVEAAMSIITVAARFWGRIVIHSISWDDWLMLITLVLFLTSTSLIAVQASIGGYRHVYYLTEDRIVEALKINFILRVPVFLSYATVKMSIGAFILRIIRKQQRWQGIVIWVTMVMTPVVNVVACIMLFVQCRPVEVVWDPRIPGKCWDMKIQTRFGIFVTAVNIVANIILGLIPVTFVFKLSLTLHKKIGLTVLFSLSLIALIASFMKIPALLNEKNFYPDFTWGEYEVTIWSISETWVIMVCGSLPGVKPLLDRHLPKHLQDTDDSSNRQPGRPDDYGLASLRRAAASSHGMRGESDWPQHRRRELLVDPEDRWIRATTRIDIQREILSTTSTDKALPPLPGEYSRI